MSTITDIANIKELNTIIQDKDDKLTVSIDMRPHVTS
jgi:hypothetical protein